MWANGQQAETALIVAVDFAAQILGVLRRILRGVQAVVCVLPKINLCIGNGILMNVQNATMQPNTLTWLTLREVTAVGLNQ
jgi:hypothetical protein